MIKVIPILVLILASLFHVANGQNVGIGTATPGSKLQIWGNMSIGFNAPTTAPANGLRVLGNSELNGDVIIGSGSTSYTLPATDGTNNQVMATNGSGTVSWSSFSQVPAGIICMWSGTLATIPSGWALCDGTNGTPDLRDRFVLSVNTAENPGATGGSHDITLAIANLPSHNHTGTTSSDGGFTPAGTINNVSAGTPAGTISNESAGTPAGTINSVSAGTPAGTISNETAGTPAGTISSETAGTPAGTINSVSAGTPAGTISAVSAGTPAGTISTNGAHTHSERVFTELSCDWRGGGSCSDHNETGRNDAGTTGSAGDHNHTFTGTAMAAHGHTFTGTALGTHGHTFTGTALGTHGHTFTGTALGTHGHTFTGTVLGTHGHTFTGTALGTHGHTFTGTALGVHGHTFTGTAVAAHNHTFTTSSVGSATPVVVTPKYYKLAFIMKL